MKSICKLAMVVLLLVGSYKMYGQSGGCGSDSFQACMNVCLWQYAQNQSDCAYWGLGTYDWSACMSEVNWEMCSCAFSCGSQYGCNISNISYCNNPNSPYDPQ
jgi:hypothetical protein